MIFQFNQYTLDTDQYRLSMGKTPIPVEPQVFDLLAYLIKNRDRVVTRDELLENLWKGKVVTDSALGVRLKDARKAVGDNGTKQEVIKTIHGRGYQFIAEVTDSTTGKSQEKKVDTVSFELHGQPSIAVLPFTNLSGDSDQEYFSDGITEDIITELSHFRDLSVIARNSSFAFRDQYFDIVEVGQKLNVRYVLEGSIRKVGERVRVTAQLIDTMTGTHVWADHFDRDLEDVFAVQDEVVRIICTTLIGKVQHAGHELARRKSPSSIKAYDCVVLGLNHFYKWTPEDNQQARELFEQAVKIDPEYASAYAWLAEAHFREGFNAWSTSYENSFSLLFEYAVKAVALDDNDSHTHASLGVAYLFRGEHDLALSQLKQALVLNPSNTDAMVQLARCEALAGKPEKGVDRLAEALRFNPLANYQWYAGQIQYIAGKYEEAVQALSTLSSPNALVYAFLAASHGQLGNIAEARESASLYVAMAKNLVDASGAPVPESWVQFVTRRYSFKRREDSEHLRAGLEKAGLS